MNHESGYYVVSVDKPSTKTQGTGSKKRGLELE
jgi:hypothetical protein